MILTILGVTAMGGYEVTAKSPRLLGQPIPGWSRTCQVEHLVPWRQPTRIFPLDKALHEGQEAFLYYGMMAGLIDGRRPFTRPPSLRTAIAAPPGVSVPDHAPGTDRHHSATRG